MLFEPWLNAQGYSPTTVKSTLRVVRRAGEVFAEGGDLGPYADSLRRVAAWASENPMGAPTPFLQTVLTRFQPLKGRTLAGGLRGLASGSTEPLNEEQWQALVAALDSALHAAKAPKKARVLQALLAFAHPARDLQLNLTLDLPELIRQAPPSAAPVLRAIRREGARSLAEYLDPDGGGQHRAAYHLLHKYLLDTGRRIGVQKLTFRAVEVTSWRIRARTAWE